MHTKTIFSTVTNAPTTKTNAPAKGPEDSLIRRLRDSELFRSYQRIYQEATGLPLGLRQVRGEPSPVRCTEDGGSRFCQLLNGGGSACEQCAMAHRHLAAEPGMRTITCFAGLQVTVIPVLVGTTVAAQLTTGHICTEKLSHQRFDNLAKSMKDQGGDEGELAEAYLNTTVIEKRKYQAMVTLLAAFSLQLNELASQISLQLRRQKGDAIAYAKDYIEENLCEQILLDEVASEVYMSRYYLCRRFKKATGMTLTNYVSRRRVEMAEEMLRSTPMKVADIAFEVGFQSLSQFNRTFHKINGHSPTEYRRELEAA